MKNEVGLFLITAFAPIGSANKKLWDNFIEKLETCISRKHPNDILVIGCDTNSSIGTSYKRSTTVLRDWLDLETELVYVSILAFKLMIWWLLLPFTRKIIIQSGIIEDQSYLIKSITLLLKKKRLLQVYRCWRNNTFDLQWSQSGHVHTQNKCPSYKTIFY